MYSIFGRKVYIIFVNKNSLNKICLKKNQKNQKSPYLKPRHILHQKPRKPVQLLLHHPHTPKKLTPIRNNTKSTKKIFPFKMQILNFPTKLPKQTRTKNQIALFNPAIAHPPKEQIQDFVILPRQNCIIFHINFSFSKFVVQFFDIPKSAENFLIET
jgi:hypothetical protein